VVKCWASNLGGCSVEQSAEHYFTRGLFKGRTVLVRGFEWLHGEAKEIGIDSLTVKNLCRRHNTQLSEVDQGAIRLFQTIEEVIRVQNVRTQFKRKRFSNFVKHHVDGRIFERWAAKFLIGLVEAAEKERRWHITGAPQEEPPPAIIHAVFGERPFNSPLGLYTALMVGETAEHVDGVSAVPYYHPETHGIAGAAIYFQGIRFVIWLHTDDPHEYIIDGHDGSNRTFGFEGESLIYHPRQINFKVRNAWS
jgi:hypothetical protein